MSILPDFQNCLNGSCVCVYIYIHIAHILYSTNWKLKSDIMYI